MRSCTTKLLHALGLTTMVSLWHGVTQLMFYVELAPPRLDDWVIIDPAEEDDIYEELSG